MKLIFLIIICVCFDFQVMAKELAITFDDSPRAAKGYLDGPKRARTLIDHLEQHDVEQVAFFSVSQGLDEEGKKRLAAYDAAGHLIANHTHTHPNINESTFAAYKEEFLQADVALKGYKNFKKWFRFPYLREGDTLEKRDGMRHLFKEKGYFNAYITLNNYDWYMEVLFQDAVKQQGVEFNFEAMKDFYVAVIIEGIEYYDQMAIKHIQRSPKHVLLLHEMDISALFIGDLVDALREKGWSIITPEAAYSDPIAQYQTEQVLKFNPGRIGEIARAKGQKKGLWHNTLDEAYLKQRFEAEVLGIKAPLKTEATVEKDQLN